MSDGNRIGGGFAAVVAGVASIGGNQAVRPASKLDELILSMTLAVQGVGARGPRGRPQVRWRLPVISHRHLSGRALIGEKTGGIGTGNVIAKITRAVCHIHAQPVSKIEIRGTTEDISVWDRCHAVREIPIAILGNHLDVRQAAFRGHRNLDWRGRVARPIGPVTRIMRRHAIRPAGEHIGRAGKGAAAQCKGANAGAVARTAARWRDQ